MSIVYLLIPLGVLVMGIALWAFLWAVKSGQFDDLEGPAHRILLDDDDPRIPRPPGRSGSSPERSREPDQ